MVVEVKNTNRTDENVQNSENCTAEKPFSLESILSRMNENDVPYVS